ncbi:hypothetical protein [Amycolatopsis sp. cmx-11-32]|uniref:hypothetical protein n=1 Tax=Amycolatopsis sp. cmx-11-32 TaxID=2785796 RepID=UPI0039E51076
MVRQMLSLPVENQVSVSLVSQPGKYLAAVGDIGLAASGENIWPPTGEKLTIDRTIGRQRLRLVADEKTGV